MKKVILFSLLVFLFACKPSDNKNKDTENNTFDFAFMTDIHLTKQYDAVEGFRQSIDTLKKLNPDFLITGGDLIMDALAEEFATADSLYSLYNIIIKDVDIPVHNTLGNHEVFGLYEKSGVDTTHALYYKKLYEQRIGKRYYSFEHKGWKFYVIDDIGKTKDRKYIGHIDQKQMDWIKEDLKKVDKNTPIVLSLHIPLVSVFAQYYGGATKAHSDREIVTNAKDFLALFDQHNLKLVLQGHTHHLESVWIEGTTYLTSGAVSGKWWHGPFKNTEEGFLLIRAEENSDKFTWEYIDYGWEPTVSE